MTILYGFKLDANGRMMDRLFDHDKLPPDWYDSPDKVPGSPEYEAKHAKMDVVFYVPQTIAVAHEPVKNKGGRPKGSKNKVSHV